MSIKNLLDDILSIKELLDDYYFIVYKTDFGCREELELKIPLD